MKAHRLPFVFVVLLPRGMLLLAVHLSRDDSALADGQRPACLSSSYRSLCLRGTLFPCSRCLRSVRLRLVQNVTGFYSATWLWKLSVVRNPFLNALGGWQALRVVDAAIEIDVRTRFAVLTSRFSRCRLARWHRCAAAAFVQTHFCIALLGVVGLLPCFAVFSAAVQLSVCRVSLRSSCLCLPAFCVTPRADQCASGLRADVPVAGPRRCHRLSGTTLLHPGSTLRARLASACLRDAASACADAGCSAGLCAMDLVPPWPVLQLPCCICLFQSLNAVCSCML